jgi:hypothetical protein
MDSTVISFVPGRYAYGRVGRSEEKAYVVVSRTDRFVTLRDQDDKPHRVRLRHDSQGNEWALLFGRTPSAMIVRPRS